MFKIIENNLEKSFGIIYNILFYISLVSIIIVISFISGVIYIELNVNNDNVIKMLAPLGITLSALLASTSVMKSIQNTNRIKKIKNKMN
jgi:hypothetical protein